MAETNWHIIHTKPGRERKVAKLLARKNITCFLPLTSSDEKKKSGESPVFPRYIFIAATDADKKGISRSRDVINFMYWLDKRAVVNNEEVNAIKSFLNEYSCTRLDKIDVNPALPHRLSNELQFSRKGNVVEANIGMVKLTIPSLGIVMVAEVRKEKAEEVIPIKNSLIGSMTGS